MLSSEDRFNIIKQSIAGQIEGPAYEAIQAAEQESLQANTEEAPQSEQQTQIPQTPVGPPPAQTIPRVYDQLGSLIEPGSTGVGLNQMAGTSPGQTIQPGEYKTGGKKPPSTADKARKFRMMRPAQGEYFEGQKENSHSTHLATTYEADGKYYVVPSITNKKAPYANYQPQSFREAMDAGEGIQFDTEKEAIKFAEGSWKLPKYPRPEYKTGGPTDPPKYFTPGQIEQGKIPNLLHLEGDLNTFIGNPKHERVDPKNTKAYKDFEKGREAIGKKKQKLVDSLNERYEKNFEYSDLTQAERDKFENYNKEINAFENSELAKKVNKEGKWFDEKADPLRHVYTSAVTSKNISDKIKNIPYLGKVADFTGADDAIGMVGSNVLGAGHELAAWGNALSKNKGFLANLKESGQDMYNNFLGSYIGVTSDNKEEIEKKTTNYVKSGYTAAGKVSGDSVYKTGGPKSKAPKPLTESDAKLEKEWPLMLQKQRFVESGFNTNAKSSKGATGSAQIMPDTLDYAKMKGWVPETISMKDLTGAEGYSISKHIQEKYMDNLFNRSWNKGTNEAKKAKALLAYNWGPENTRVKLNKLIDQGVNVWDNTDFTKYFNEESRQYKGKILDDLTTKKDPYVQRDYKKLKDLSPLLRMHGGPKVLYNNKKLKK